MKKRLLITSVFATLSLSVMTGVIFSGKQVTETNASSYPLFTVPTTIDLNDTSSADIRSYYSSLSSLSVSERSGTNLLKNLKPILKNNQRYLSYDSSDVNIWKAYEITDRDWDKSPASEISGYNAITNTITGYKYGTSTSSKGTNPYVHALYVNRNVDNQTTAWSDHSQNNWGINREHIWPKSYGFNDTCKTGGARGDLMHLWAGNGRVNGTHHNNNFYGYVDTTKSYDDAGDDYSYLQGNLRGKSKSLGGTYNVFEPQDSDKGDIARSVFYMVARYNFYSKSDSDGIDAGNPNLELVNQVLNESSYTSTKTEPGQMGILQDLLEWNRLDPPDEFEIHRNNLLYTNFTYNRNPFIDFPEWAEYIWGKSTNGSYNPTVTGYATPASDALNVFSAGKTLTSLEVSNAKTTYTVGEDFVAPTVTANYSDKSSKDVSELATFSGYNMLTKGEQTVNVLYTEGATTKTTSYSITINEQSSESVATLDFSAQGYDNGQVVESLTINPITATFSKGTGSSSPAYYTSGSAVRLYWGGTMTVSSSFKLKKIKITFGSDDGSNTIGVDCGTFDGSTWTGDSNTVVFTIDGTKGQRRIKSIVVTYEGTVEPLVNSVAISPNILKVQNGTDSQLTAIVNVTGAISKAVTWSTNNGSVVSVSDSGVITANSVGNAVITATSVADPTKSGTCSVSVVEYIASNSPETAFTTSEVIGYIDEGSLDPTGTYYVKGNYVSTQTEYSETYKNISINVTDNIKQFQFYRMNMESIRTFSVGEEVIASGTGDKLILYKTKTTETYEFSGCNWYSGGTDPTPVEEPEVINTTLLDFISYENVKTQAYRLTAQVKSWYGTNTDGTQYGNFILTDGENDLIIYGSTATSSALSWSVNTYVFTNPTDFLTNDLTKNTEIGYNVTIVLIRDDFNGNVQGKGIIESAGPVSAVENLIIFDKNSCTTMTDSAGGQSQVLDGLTLTISNGLKSTELKMYKNSTTTLNSDVNILRIEFVCTASGETKYGPNGFTEQTGYTYEGNIGTWVGSSKTVSFKAGNEQVRASEIRVYRETPVNTWCESFMSNLTCDGGVTAPSTTVWSNLKSSYQLLPSADRTLLQTYDHPALDRYDYIIGKYGTSAYENYIGRAVSGAPSVNPINVISTSTSTWLIISVSLVGITSIGGYFFYKKRREN